MGEILNDIWNIISKAAEKQAEDKVKIYDCTMDQYMYYANTKRALDRDDAISRMEKETDPDKKRRMGILIDEGVYNFKDYEDIL